MFLKRTFVLFAGVPAGHGGVPGLLPRRAGVFAEIVVIFCATGVRFHYFLVSLHT